MMTLKAISFSLVSHPLVHHIGSHFKLFLYVRYLDDDIFIGYLNEVTNAFNIIREISPRLGLQLNGRKTGFFWGFM